MPLVLMYPSGGREELGAERYECEWEQIKASAVQRVRMMRKYAAAKHDREQHGGDWEKCEKESCKRGQYAEYDRDADFETHFRVFRGADAHEKAREFAQKEVNKGKTAFGVIMVYKQVVDWFVEEDRVGEWSTVGDGEEVTAECVTP